METYTVKDLQAIPKGGPSEPRRITALKYVGEEIKRSYDAVIGG